MKEVEALRELEEWLQQHKQDFNSLILEGKLRAIARARVSDKVYAEGGISEEAHQEWLKTLLADIT